MHLTRASCWKSRESAVQRPRKMEILSDGASFMSGPRFLLIRSAPIPAPRARDSDSFVNCLA